MNGQIDGWMDRYINGWMDKDEMDEWMGDEIMNGWTDEDGVDGWTDCAYNFLSCGIIPKYSRFIPRCCYNPIVYYINYYDDFISLMMTYWVCPSSISIHLMQCLWPVSSWRWLPDTESYNREKRTCVSVSMVTTSRQFIILSFYELCCNLPRSLLFYHLNMWQSCDHGE